MMRGIQDKVIVVTGGGGGMGAAICRRLAEEGAKVAIFDVDEGLARKVAGGLSAGSAQVHVEIVDIADSAAVEAAVARTEQAVGPIDVLVNNAGWDRYRRFLDTDE